MIKKLYIFFFIFLIFCNKSFAKSGEGELKLSKYTMEIVMMYMYGAGNTKYSGDGKSKHDPMVMAISVDGNYSYYYYCPKQYKAQGGCMDNNTSYKAILDCEKFSNGVPCFIFARERRIVWKNGNKKVSIKRKDLKSPYKVASIIQDAGFYDGDIKDLEGIDVETGQIDEDRKITGDDKSLKNNQSSNSIDLVKELETLTTLFENGSLTKEEYQKAKDKLLNN